MKVDYIILGAQKCATSTLFAILANHPSIEACKVKEPHFFSTSNDWKMNLAKYEKLFCKRSDAKYLESSTSYTFFPHRRLGIWNDLYEYNCKMKFIYLVRNPIDRIVSNYMHNNHKGYTDADIEKIIFKNPLFINITRYYTQIMPFIRKFGRESILIIDFEDVINNREGVLRRISEFFEIDFDGFKYYEQVHCNKSIDRRMKYCHLIIPDPLLNEIRKRFPNTWHLFLKTTKKDKKKPRLSKQLQKAILHMLDFEINSLQELLGKDLTIWKKIKSESDERLAESSRQTIAKEK